MDLRAMILAFRENSKKATEERKFLIAALKFIQNYEAEDGKEFSYEGLESKTLTEASAEVDERLTALKSLNDKLTADAAKIKEEEDSVNSAVSASIAALEEMELPTIISGEHRTPSHQASNTPMLVENAETGEQKYVLPSALFSGTQGEKPRVGIGEWLTAELGDADDSYRKIIGENSGVPIPLDEVMLGHAVDEHGRRIVQAAVGTANIPTLRNQLENISPFMAANYFSDMLTVKTSDGRGENWDEDDFSKTGSVPSSGEITAAVESDPNLLERSMTPDDGRLFTDASKRSLRMRAQWQPFIEAKLDTAFRTHHSREACFRGNDLDGIVGLANNVFVSTTNNVGTTGDPKTNLINGIVSKSFDFGGAASTPMTEAQSFADAYFDAMDDLYARSPNTSKVMAIRRGRLSKYRRAIGTATGVAPQLSGAGIFDIDGTPMIPIDVGFPGEPTANNEYRIAAIIGSFSGEEAWMDISHAELIVKDLPETGQYRFIFM